jgi:antitoxin VapB
VSLNIKNEHVHALAREAAQRTGRSQTSVIEQALEEYLARLEGDGAAERAKTERINRILADFDKRLADGPPLMNIDDLYDERGLPA